MAEDLKWELTILEVVHGFDLSLLEQRLQQPPPLPAAVEPQALHAPGADLSEALRQLRCWLRLLDLAIPTEILRKTLAEAPDQDLAEALLRYFASKRSAGPEDRDKADLLATFLYRNPRVPGQWELHGYSLDGVAPVPPFEIALLEVLGEEVPELTGEQDRALAELEEMRDEIAALKSFEELIDADCVSRIRQWKEALGESFYHPRALAIVAGLNDYFGRRFDELFRTAAREIRNYGEEQQQSVGNSAKVMGHVTVRQLVELQEEQILGQEYTKAQDRLRHVAQLKKAVTRRKVAATEPAAARLPYGAARQQSSPFTPGLAPQRISSTTEQTKLHSVEDSIRAFVRAADPRFRQIVPMKFGNLTLSPAEADAYCAELSDEKSFRADNAKVLVRMVALTARVSSELAELRQRQNSTHLWRPHAESIALLTGWAGELTHEAGRVMQTAQQRGLVEKVQILTASVQKMQERITEAGQVVSSLTVPAGV